MTGREALGHFGILSACASTQCPSSDRPAPFAFAPRGDALARLRHAAPPRPLAGLIPHITEGDHFDVVSDLQRTSHLEFWRESNDPERRILVRAIAADRPAFLAITGDLSFQARPLRNGRSSMP